MSFRLFGVNVEIQISFWIMAVLFWPEFQNGIHQGVVIWVAVVFLSVLAHEMGHALAILRHKIEPEITLHGMGGHTRWNPTLPLRRRDQVLISAAGPLAGLLLFALIRGFRELAPGVYYALPGPVGMALVYLEWVNKVWSIFNLIPVMPLDGGHILEHALGPRRIRISAGISLGLAGLLIVYFLRRHEYWGVFIFGMAAVQNFQRLRAEGPAPAVRPSAPPRPSTLDERPLPPGVVALLKQARSALAEEDGDRARALAEQVLAGEGSGHELGGEAPPEGPAPEAARVAHEIVAWSHLLAGRVDQAHEALGRARKMGEPDPALLGAVLLARGDTQKARGVLEGARSKGDGRKEVAGPLIQILLAQGEVARAAATALDIVDQLSEEDARKMASLAYEGGSFEWSGRLYEAVFARDNEPEDAYDAARAHAKAGENDRAAELLRRAVAAGFTDAARAWSDAALEPLRAARELDAIVPRPEKA